MLRRISILGATGSIGASTFALIDGARDDFEIVALTAGQNVLRLIELARIYRPEFIAIADVRQYRVLADALADLPIEVAAGVDALVLAARIPTDVCVAAIVGIAGLSPSLAALEHKQLILANKEVLVAAGDLFMRTAAAHGTQILPADSEHNAVAQILHGHATQNGVAEEIILTASGGPFWETPSGMLAHVTPTQACAHPNWSMGAKISVDSATMMNKGLELIEAKYLFTAPPSPRFSILVHPQSVVHGLVRFTDGTVVASLGVSDMRLPLAWCLGFPDGMTSGVESLDLISVGRLDFAAPDDTRFPCLALARAALADGKNMPNILNAANEVAVEAFLDGRINFTDIAHLVESALDYGSRTLAISADSLDDILMIDDTIRDWTRAQINIGKGTSVGYNTMMQMQSGK